MRVESKVRVIRLKEKLRRSAQLYRIPKFLLNSGRNISLLANNKDFFDNLRSANYSTACAEFQSEEQEMHRKEY